jgi:hypothetical protein
VKPARFLTWFDDDVCGEWTENKLLSRKWLVSAGVLVWVLLVDLMGRPVSDTTASIVQVIIPAFVGVQGFVDMYRYRAAVRRRRKKEECVE